MSVHVFLNLCMHVIAFMHLLVHHHITCPRGDGVAYVSLTCLRMDSSPLMDSLTRLFLLCTKAQHYAKPFTLLSQHTGVMEALVHSQL